MTPRFLDVPAKHRVVRLNASDGLDASAHVLDTASALAVNAALGARRPLLVRGEPGTGKSQLARAVAQEFGRVFVHHTVDSRTETRDLLWTVDAVARLAKAQILGALPDEERKDAVAEIAVDRFVRPGPIWWAFDPHGAERQERKVVGEASYPKGKWHCSNGVVVLIDEIDKADGSVPNGLLDALGNRSFKPEGCPAVQVTELDVPLVVITTNEERVLPDAFLRRCVVLHLKVPANPDELRDFLFERGKAHFGDGLDQESAKVLREAAELVITDRVVVAKRTHCPPGVAEYIDLLTAVRAQRSDPVEQIALLHQIRSFVLDKHDIESGL